MAGADEVFGRDFNEPLAPFLDPLVSLLGSGLYFSQSQRGELVGGMGDPAEPEGVVQGSTLRFLARYGVDYVYVGGVERAAAPAATAVRFPAPSRRRRPRTSPSPPAT